MKKGLFLLIGVLMLSLVLTGCKPETTDEESGLLDANTSEAEQIVLLDTNTTEDSNSLEEDEEILFITDNNNTEESDSSDTEDSEISLIPDDSNSSTTYDLVAYMLPIQSATYAYDVYMYADVNLTYTALGDSILDIEISGNNYNIFGGEDDAYDDTYFSIKNKTKRYVSMGEIFTSIFKETCVITAHYGSYTYPHAEGYSYEDVLEGTCGEYKMYYAGGIGLVAEIEEHCLGDDGYAHDDWNTSQCASTTGYYRLLQVD